jgi:hypothetical protein
MCAFGKIMQNCQTLVPEPMMAPSVWAEGWICFFCAFCVATVVGLSGALKSTAFFLPEYAASIRGKTVAHQEMSANRKT